MREMKDSGVEWIDKIPSSWSIVPLKTMVSFGKGLPITKENLIEKGVAVVSYGQIHSKINVGSHLNKELVRYVSYEYLQSNRNCLAKKGDILIADTSENYEGIGNSVLNDWDENLFAGYHTVIIRPSDRTYSKYLAYLFMTDSWRSQLRSRASGIKVFSVTQGLLKKTAIIIPRENSVQKITDYLDAKCSKLDEIIEKQQAIIEKLKEYKLSIITEAVTKGINPNIEIKDSGIEWIGYIPKCWNISRFKYLSSEIGDGLHSTPVYDSEGDYYFMNGQNIGNEKLVFSDKTDRLNELEYMKYKKPLLSENTIFITLNGATYGKSSFYNGEKVLLGKSAGYITLKSSENKRYIRYYLQSRTAKIFMELSLCGSTIANLSLKTLNEFIIPLPSEDEQRRIVDFLDVRCKLIDHNIDEKGKIVEKLQEYKKSLIYEVVTGKKEV